MLPLVSARRGGKRVGDDDKDCGLCDGLRRMGGQNGSGKSAFCRSTLGEERPRDSRIQSVLK